MASLLTVLNTLALVCIDQHRLQPWAWQFTILSFVLAFADVSTSRAAWRWLVIGIYFWSAWSKIDRSFYIEHGPFLINGFCKSIGMVNGAALWSNSLRWNAAAAIPIFEMVVAIGLIAKRTRLTALIAATFMHVTLIMALGPLGHGHQPGVLVWNIFFIAQNWIIFQRVPETQLTSAETRSFNQVRAGNILACCIVSAAMLWPALESFGFCDHWPAWAVYAAKPERTTIFVHADEIAKVPEKLRRYLQPQSIPDDWYSFRIDRWSLDALAVPIYPQDRFQVGVALGLANGLNLDTIRIVIESSANRWTGKRETAEYIGLESVNALANSFRCGARPRKSQFVAAK